MILELTKYYSLVLFLAALTTAESSRADFGTPDEDPVVASIQQRFKNAINNPISESLLIDKKWSNCKAYWAGRGDHDVESRGDYTVTFSKSVDINQFIQSSSYPSSPKEPVQSMLAVLMNGELVAKFNSGDNDHNYSTSRITTEGDLISELSTTDRGGRTEDGGCIEASAVGVFASANRSKIFAYEVCQPMK